MATKHKLPRFGRRYDTFLSEASNEEIVSISKELTDEFALQTKQVNTTGLSLLGVSLVALMLTIMLISSSTTTTSGSTRDLVFLLRILSITVYCAAVALASMAVSGSLNASSLSTMFWRNVRETADDEKVFEQMQAVRSLNVIISSSKSNLKLSVYCLVLGGLLIGVAYLYEMLVASGYL